MALSLYNIGLVRSPVYNDDEVYMQMTVELVRRLLIMGPNEVVSFKGKPGKGLFDTISLLLTSQ